MEYSRHNIFGPVGAATDQFYLINLLSRQADFLDATQASWLQGGALPPEVERAEWVAKGYVVDPAEERSRHRQAYLDFLDARERDEVQVFFVPWYTCNFSCSYCFQDEYDGSAEVPEASVVDSFFRFLTEKLSGRRRYVTLFGGEPLLPSGPRRAFLERFCERCQEEGVELAVVTNGFHLREALPLLQKATLREVQVTLDGPAIVHDRRRYLKGGGSSFARIVDGVDAAIEAGVTVNLRVVVDRENLPFLPELAQFAIERGWTASPHFKTQLGRNYELHHCQDGRERLLGRLELHQELARLVAAHPTILEFHRPAFSVTRFLVDEGELPLPLFDACTGTKTEWALDGLGRVFACTATVGKGGEELGRFHPTLELSEDACAPWEERDVLAMEACRSCSVQLACGGGCAAIAKNQRGALSAPDCRPVAELVSLGTHFYASGLLQE